MKPIFILLLSFAGLSLQAQSGPILKKVLELQMPKTAEDDMPGTRGASVAWHPVEKKYYASFAGNVDYPFAVFNAKGTRLSPASLTAMTDVRGLWYDPARKQICGNGYEEFGWFTYKLNAAGIPDEVEVQLEGLYQPDNQSVGAYNPVNKQVLFVYEDDIISYDGSGIEQNTILINWGHTGKKTTADISDLTLDESEFNSTTLIYTGIKGQELGFLNLTDKTIELYNMNTGYLAKVLKLPENAPTEPIFNFAYANGIYWLFDIMNRKWKGYK